MWLWEYESCNRCGNCYRLPYIVKDDIWLKINGREGGCLCFNCFIQIANEKNVLVQLEDIEVLWVFQKEGTYCFNIIGKI